MPELVKAEVSSREPREYALVVNGRRVGALRAGALAFHDFASPDAARDAAVVAAMVLGEWYRDRWRTAEELPADWPVAEDAAVHAGGTLVGRLLHPNGESGRHGFELRIPDHLWVATGLGLAQRIHSALAGELAVNG